MRILVSHSSKKVLENNGYRVDQKHYEKITAESLEGIDVFCLVEPYFALLDSDKSFAEIYQRWRLSIDNGV